MKRSLAPSRKQLERSTQPTANLKVSGINAKETGTDTKLMKFIVCYGKFTKRKQKTYSDDGELEISGVNATLRNAQGKVVGSTQIKLEKIEEGSKLMVSGMEVQIVSESFAGELSSEQKIVNFEVKTEDKTEEGPSKKIKEKTFDEQEVPKNSLESMELSDEVNNINHNLKNCVSQKSSGKSNDESISYSPHEQECSEDSMDNEFDEKTRNKQPKVAKLTKTFIVCYAKASSKMHKIYNNDGTLEVCGNKAVLKDSNKKIIGSSCLKNDIEQITTFRMIGKDIEIVGLLTTT